jgi:hypothetical protein
MGKGRGRCENGASLDDVVCEKLHWRIPKVSITVLKVGTVTPLLGSKLLDPQKKKNKKKNILSSSCDTVVTFSSYTISSSDIATTIL